MKNRYFIVVFLGVLSIAACKTPYKLQQKTSFRIIKGTYQDWVGGVPGNSGTLVQLFVTDTLGIHPDSLFFQDKVAVIDIKPSNKDVLWVANFRKETPNENRLGKLKQSVDDTDSLEKPDFPFKLLENEAVIRYTKEGKVYYYKITGLLQKETIFYPAARPQKE